MSTLSQILWLLYFTSEDDAAMLRVFNTGSRGSFSRGSGHGGRASSIQTGARSSMAHGGNTAVSYQGHGGSSTYQGLKSAQLGSTGPGGMSVGDLSAGGHTDGGVGHSPAAGGASSLLGDHTGDQQEYALKARALYSCECSFARPPARVISLKDSLTVLVIFFSLPRARVACRLGFT